MSLFFRRAALVAAALLLQSCVRDMATEPQAGPAGASRSAGAALAGPTGTTIAFAASPTGDVSVWSVNGDGSGARNLIGFPAGSQSNTPAWSADGNRIAYSSTLYNTWNIVVAERDGSMQALVTSGPTGATEADPSWAPDDSRLVYYSTVSGDQELYTVRADGGDVRRLTTLPGEDSHPSWSPDGSVIAFAHLTGTRSDIYLVAPDGTGLTRLTDDSALARDPAWSPDGTALAFTSLRDGHAELYVMQRDGTGQRRVTVSDSGAASSRPAWSPDGAALAYTRSAGGARDVYVVNLDGTGATRASLGVDFASSPAWAGPPVTTGRLAFLTPPPDTVGLNRPISPPIQVGVVDAAGNVIPDATDPVTILLVTPFHFGNPTFSRLHGTTTVNAVNGVATFSDLSFDRVDSDLRLSASAHTRNSVLSGRIAVRPADKLVFLTSPPSSIDADLPMTVRVAIVDPAGNVRTGVNDLVYIVFHSAGTTIHLEGTDPRAAVNGIATFDDLRVTGPGSGFTLDAISSGRLPASSTPFASHVTFASVSPGHQHTCGLSIHQVAYCWGNGAIFQLGNGQRASELTPIRVGGVPPFKVISPGRAHTCALTADGVAYCWGEGLNGALGNGGTANAPGPVPVAGGHRFTMIAGGATHTCALGTDHTVYCWGGNARGELGTGTTVPSLVPVAVSGNRKFDALSVGWTTSCGLSGGGNAYCWGQPFGGLPTKVTGASGLTTLSRSASHGCGMGRKGETLCWGEGRFGGLGDGTTVDRLLAAAPASAAPALTSVQVGHWFTCGLVASGEGECWGYNALGTLGDGTRVSRGSPAVIAGGHRFAMIGTGFESACGVTVDGALYCWGDNFYGQLGDGTTTTRLEPMLVRQ